MLDGRVVALKVRRPEIAKLVRADLDIIKNLAQLVERSLPNLAVYRPLSLAREFERTIKRELDFSIERRTMQRCRIQFADDPTAHIPLVIEELSTPSVIAMEFIEGVSVDDLAGIRRLHAEPAEVAVTGARILLRQIFEYGFFHADPHPGNLRVLEGGVIAPLDYGMFGQLDGKTRERIADLLSGLLAQDSDRVIRSLESPRYPGRKARLARLSPRRRRARRLVLGADARHDRPVLAAARARDRDPYAPPAHPPRPGPLDPVAGDHRGRRPPPRPSFRHCQVSSRRSSVIWRCERFRPDRILSQTVRTTEDLQRIATLLPDLLSQSLDSIKRGELRVHFDLQGFERMVRKVTRASNSLSVGIVIAGLLVASSLVLRVGSVTLAYAGFTTGLVLCLWLVWNMSTD